MSISPVTLPPCGRIVSYLNFDGRCQQAIDFYTKTLGAQVSFLLHFKDAPSADGEPHPPERANKVIHCTLVVQGTILHATDGECSMAKSFSGMSLALTLPTNAEAESVFAALSEGGKVEQAMAPTFFSERFGCLSDKFGVRWMVLGESARQA